MTPSAEGTAPKPENIWDVNIIGNLLGFETNFIEGLMPYVIVFYSLGRLHNEKDLDL